MILATVSSWSWFCWLYRVSPSLAAKNIINLISVLSIWWCPCVESSLVCSFVVFCHCAYLLWLFVLFPLDLLTPLLWCFLVTVCVSVGCCFGFRCREEKDMALVKGWLLERRVASLSWSACVVWVFPHVWFSLSSPFASAVMAWEVALSCWRGDVEDMLI